jgi:hypothetical protein
MRFLLLAALAAASVSAQADVPTYTNQPSGEYMKEWLVCGPFPLTDPGDTNVYATKLKGMYTDYLQSQGGEAAPRAVEGQPVPFDGGSVAWKRYASPENVVDLDAALGKADAVVAYAYCEVESPRQQTAVLALGSNDGVRAWVNGENVWNNPASRGLKLDHDLVPVVLKQGRNTLLLKVEDRGNRWELACRLLPLDHNALAEKFGLFEVVQAEDGSPRLRMKQSETLLRTVLKGAKLEVASAAETGKALWSGTWSGEPEMVLPIHEPNYGEYILRIDADLGEGVRQALEIPFAAGQRVEHTLFADGRTEYAIVVADDASDSEKWAARELQTWLKEVSGIEFPMAPVEGVGQDKEAITAKRIVVGFNPLTRYILGGEAQAPADHDESFTYRSVGPALVIYGGKARGTMYGVMSFLEREMGVRFYTPRVTVTPKKAKYTFTYLYHSERPGVRVRNDFYHEAFEPIWAARNRVNGAMSYREQPGGLECYWAVHTFYPLMPPEEFFEEHPEYYSLIDGKRTYERAQLCLTNPDVLRIITERIKQKMRELPEYLIYDVSQNDWANPCQCANCQAIAQREESESGPVIWFVNQVAENVQPEFPDKFIGTLAYQYTRKPPKTLKPRENVVVRFCSIECCFAHPFTECPENESFVADMNGWAAIAPHIYIWDYVVNFSHYIMPYPNFRVLQPNIQFFRDHNAIGIMEQAAYQSRGGEFAELRAYVIAKLLWNPECDVQEVINDFMYGYYGRAGQYVRAYFDLLHGQLTPDTHIGLGLQPDDKLFSDKFVEEAEALFDRAEDVADNEEIRRRVEMARLPIMYLKCKRTPVQAKEDGTYARFCEIVEREGVTHYAEAGESDRQSFHEQMEGAQ